MKIDGDTVYEYIMMCEDEDKALADRGIIAKYEHGSYNDTCVVASLDQLRRALDAKVAAGWVPHGKYVKSR